MRTGEKIHIIGSGFASLSAACYLAQAGYHVHVYEKNEQLGGRARQFRKAGFTFDMGPTWYWMPDVFERFFSDFNKLTSDYYELSQLSPAYRVYFDRLDYLDIEDSLEKICAVFEDIEEGSASKLRKFISKAESNYNIAIKDLVYNPGISPLELVNLDTATEIKQFYYTIHDYVKRNFKHDRLRQILEFPVLFLGAKPSDTPLFYSFMNYADFGLGTWYPKGGMRTVVEAIIKLAESLGVTFHTQAAVERITVGHQKEVTGMLINGEHLPAEIIVSGADYKHTEHLFETQYRGYSEAYWNKKVMAPSSLLFYVGFSEKLKNVLHHTLFFDSSFDVHADEIYSTPQWPSNPLFYASFPSMTDEGTAPKDCESAIFLIPLAPGLDDSVEMREKYFELIMSRLEKLTNQSIRQSVVLKESYCVNDFIEDYNSFKGNAYGMANTLMQTAFLRPKIKSKKVKNMYFTGQLTVPGPGVPPSLISGKIVSDLVLKDHKKRKNHETLIR